MPKVSKRLLATLQESDVLDSFFYDYRILGKERMLDKYGKWFAGHAEAEDRTWKSMTEMANANGVRRGPSEDDDEKDWSGYGLSVEVSKDATVERLRTESDHWKRKYKEAIKSSNFDGLVLNAIQQAMIPLKPATVQKPKLHSPKGTRHTATAILSDLHVGEVVSPEETGGFGNYDMTIFSRRLGMWTEKVMELTELRRSRLHVPNLTLLLGGDMVAGDIHQELIKTNAVDVMEQTVQAAYMIAQSVGQLATYFESIDAYGVVGNHGRMQMKPPSKGQYQNWDYLVYQLMAMFLSKHDNIHFTIPKSFYQLVEVENTTILLIHGDSIKGYSGLPVYGIERAVMRMRTLLDQQGKRFDMVVMGHFHDPTENDRFIINGSLGGNSEYNIGKLHMGNEPSQIMFYVHPQHGLVSTERIYLSSADEEERYALNFKLPAVWAESILGG